MSDKTPKAGEWWFSDDGERRVFIHGISRKGEPIVETDHDFVYTDDWWEGWHHEPDCTGWDWVPPKYVTQDRVPARPGLDQRRWVRDDTPLTGWADASVLRHTYGDKAVHGYINLHGSRLHGYTNLHGNRLELRCLEKDLPPAKPPEQPGLEVQVGKRYVRRDGRVTGLIVYSGGADYPFRDSAGHLTYKSDGTWDVTRHPAAEDLVSEYVEPAKPEALCLFMDTYGRLYAAEKAEQMTHKRALSAHSGEQIFVKPGDL